MNTHNLSINGYRVPRNVSIDRKPNVIAQDATTKPLSFATLLNDVLAEKSIPVINNDGEKSLMGLETKSYNSYDSLFDSGFFGDDAVRIVDDRPTIYCSLCGSLLENDGSCPRCVVPLELCGNTSAQNQAIQDQHLQNHIQNQTISQTTVNAPTKTTSKSMSRLASSK